ncbi:MAG: DUF3071 domain-containing protein, partial [Sciscionella sp.]|nr:DUF3071 domain-containing protein [Sciscionella sp.]
MRQLRVIGLDEDGKFVVCEDSSGGERFTIPADERLRAAARGDITRLGQAQIELESHMRPREIQARIRAGESVEQVASAAGIPAQRVERFAYPVLLERSRTAELAQSAHPVRSDGPDVQTLAEVAEHTFSLRGQDFSTVEWDSWRGDDGKWVVQLRWRTGRSNNRAHWAFHPGAHGGTVTPLDEHAVDMVDPNPNRGLRTVGSAQRPARPEPEILAHDDEPVAVAPEEVVPPVNLVEPVLPIEMVQPVDSDPEDVETATESEPEQVEQPHEQREAVGQQQPIVARPVTAQPEKPKQTSTPKQSPTKRAKGGGKKGRPIVPSWEDVLLGVRS